jgi:hypothetical protein
LLLISGKHALSPLTFQGRSSAFSSIINYFSVHTLWVSYGIYLRSWDIVVGIVQSQAKTRKLGGPPRLPSIISGHSLHRVKRLVREFDQLHPPGDEVRKEGSYRMYGVLLMPLWK